VPHKASFTPIVKAVFSRIYSPIRNTLKPVSMLSQRFSLTNRTTVLHIMTAWDSQRRKIVSFTAAYRPQNPRCPVITAARRTILRL